MPEQEICPTCEGDGRIGPQNDDQCPTCLGNGKVPDIETCPTCLGVKYVGSDPCTACHMQGSVPLNSPEAEMFKLLTDINSKVNDNKEKLGEIKTVVDEIKVLMEE